MAQNIKGIVIEIEGKTDGLVKSLTSVEKEIKSTETALKKVNEALKLDPKNTQLVAEKQKLLANEIQNTEQKLALLEQAAQDASKALADGTISEAEYAQLASEIELTKQKLESLNKEAGNKTLAQSFEEAGQKLKEVGDKVEDVGEKLKTFGDNMTKYVTGPIVAAGAASLASFKEVDKSVDNIIKKTGATGTELEQFREIFNNIATTVPADMDTIGNAIGEVNTRFNVTGDDLERLSTLFIEYASINNTDVVNSVDNVQKALAAFGLPVSEADEMLDKLTQTSQSTGANVDTLTAGLIQNAAAFQELDLNMEQSIEFMGQLETSGANSETVMQGLRKALKNSAEDGVDLNTALQDLQESILNGKDGIDGLTLSYDTFGKSGDQIWSSVRNGTLDFSNLGKEATDAGGTVTKTFSATVDPLTKMQTATNSLKITLGDVGETIAQMVAPAVETLSEGLKELNEWWNSLSQGQQTVILSLLAIVAAIGPLIAFVGSLTIGIGQAITAVGTITAALGVAGGAGLAGSLTAVATAAWPVVAVITAVVGICWGLHEIVTGLINIIENWDLLMETLGNDLGEVFSGIKSDFESVGQNIASGIETIKGKFNEFKDHAKEKWEEIKTSSSETWENIKNTASEKLGSMKETAREKAGEIGSFFSDLGSSALTWGKDMLDNFVQGIKNAWNSFTGAVDDIVDYIADNIGFSEPKKGRLSVFHTFAPDMIDLWTKGIDDNLYKVQNSADAMTGTIAGSLTSEPDYSSQLAGINGTLTSMAGSGQPINVYIGSDRIGTAIARSNARSAYISGGH